jgi:hypothetical protein
MSADLPKPPAEPAQIGPELARQVKHFTLRCVPLALLLAWLGARYGLALTHWLLPWWQAEIGWLDDTYRIDNLFVDHEGADQVVRIVVGQAHCLVLAGVAYCGDPRGHANASTLIGHVSMAATLLLAPALAWPARRAMEYAWRVLLLPLALATVWALDVPMVLWASIYSLHVNAFAPDTFSPLLIWLDFLQGGGRLALALALGAAVVRLAQLATALRARP